MMFGKMFSSAKISTVGSLLFFFVFLSSPFIQSPPVLGENISDDLFFLSETLLMSTDYIGSNIVDSVEIPVIQHKITLPLNAMIQAIDISFSNNNITYDILSHISSNVVRIPKNGQINVTMIQRPLEKTSIIDSAELLPKEPFDYQIHVGRSKGEAVLFLVTTIYPLSFDKISQTVSFASELTYFISYRMKNKSLSTFQNYDLVIISPSEFSELLQPLIDHKNSIGTTTFIKETEDIYQQYQGRDDAEKIKYFIKDAIEVYGVKYVLLFGGLKGQSNEWYVPVRYSNLHDRSFWNDSYVTDLYFADIYRYNESSQSYEFDDWDSNSNDIIAEWTWIFDPIRGWWYDLDKKDEIDLYPDVAIGRIPCRNKNDVTDMVDKIKSYELQSYGQDWFKTVIYGGGDTIPFSDGICEGEVENAYAASMLEPLGFTSTNLWVSTGTLNGPFDVVGALRKGAGFLYLSGHGTPREWCTHPVSNDYRWIDLYSFELQNIRNSGKLPICVVGGCHNSQFDVRLSRINEGIKAYGLSYFFWEEGIDCFFKWTWVSNCWSWNLLSQPDDGAIAVIGNTGLGWGVSGTRATEYNEGFLTTRFFETYANLSQQGFNHLGTIHSETINKYISHFSANDHLLDRKTVEEWVLLGDPSLLIGGYHEE